MPGEHSQRRVVTGHNADGRSIVVQDDRMRAATNAIAVDVPSLIEVWATAAPRAGKAASVASSEFRVVEMPAGFQREMHRTETVDYGIVLAGEVVLVLERQETLLRTGDVVVQRGTMHGWHNRSGDVARLAFVNLAGQFDDPQRTPVV